MKILKWRVLAVLIILAAIATGIYVLLISEKINRYWLDHSVVRIPRGLPPDRNDRP
ncbi:MAG: hypothetical protein V1809_03385 [Planctomycetota bacterium]